jgi:SAM-dependent methyltransferase
MWLIPEDQAEAFAQDWRPKRNGNHVTDDYALEEQHVTRRDLTPGQAVWRVEANGDGTHRRVLKPSGLVGFDEYQPRAWQEVQELFTVSRLSAPETANGPGSTVELTEGLRSWLPSLFQKYDITSVLDAPCGDWSWLRYVDLTGITYTGWDVVPEMVAQASERAFVKLVTASFDVVNILTVPKIPCVDLILSRDFLAHLPDEPAMRVIDKFKSSGSKYLLTSHYPESDNVFDYDPKDFAWIGYAERAINLEREPFSLGTKLVAFPEAPGPHGVIAQHHELALFELR